MNRSAEDERRVVPRQLGWTPELVNRFWDAVSRSPLRELSFARVAGAKLLDIVAGQIPAGASIIDIGAGDGDFSALLLARGYHVAVLEPSRERRDAVAERLQNHANFLGFVDGPGKQTYDGAVLLEVIEHVLEPDFGVFLGTLPQYVRPGGFLVVTTPNNEALATAQVYCPVSDLFFHPWQHVRSFTPAALEQTLATQGFARSFLALVDFSADAEIIDRAQELRRCFDQVSSFAQQLEDELARFRALLPTDDMETAGAQARRPEIYATDDINFGHARIIREILAINQELANQVSRIPWKFPDITFGPVLDNLCNIFCSELKSLITAQALSAHCKVLSSSVAGAHQAIQGARGPMARFHQMLQTTLDLLERAQGGAQEALNALQAKLEISPSAARTGGLKDRFISAMRVAWCLFRDRSALAGLIGPVMTSIETTKSAIAKARAGDCQAEIQALLRLEPPPPSISILGFHGGVARGLSSSVVGQLGPAHVNIQESGAGDAVSAYLALMHQRLQVALSRFDPSSMSNPDHDLYVGRGSNIVYIGKRA